MLDIYVDADACPVKEDALRISKRYALKVFMVSNHPKALPKADWIVPVVVEKEFDAVDKWIDSRIQPKDICITNDLLLADLCIKRKALAIDPRGKILDEENIGEALATRELMYDLRQSGMLDLGPKKMGKNHRSNFLSEFDKLINLIKLGKY